MNKKVNSIVLVVLIIIAFVVITYKHDDRINKQNIKNVMSYNKPLSSSEIRIINEMLDASKDMKEEVYDGENNTPEKIKIEVVEEFAKLRNLWNVILPSTNINGIDKQKINNEIKNIEALLNQKEIDKSRLVQYVDILMKSLTDLTLEQ